MAKANKIEDTEILQEFTTALKDGRIEKHPSEHPGKVSLVFQDKEFEERWHRWKLRKELENNGGKRHIPRMSEQELRKFVLGWISQGLWSTIHCGHNDWSMCFLSCKMGLMLPYMEEEDPVPPEEPEPPQEPDLGSFEEPVAPTPPSLTDPNEDSQVLRLRGALEWGDSDSSEIKARLNEISVHNKELQVSFDEKLAGHQKACEDLVEHKAELLQKWKAEKEEWSETFEAYEVAYGEYEERLEDYKQKWVKSYDDQWADLGIIWEWLDSKNRLARGINGMPMFLSARLMHKEDWERAKKVIDEEHERQQKLDV